MDNKEFEESVREIVEAGVCDGDVIEFDNGKLYRFVESGVGEMHEIGPDEDDALRAAFDSEDEGGGDGKIAGPKSWS